MQEEVGLLGEMSRVPNWTNGRPDSGVRRLGCMSKPMKWDAVYAQALKVGE